VKTFQIQKLSVIRIFRKKKKRKKKEKNKNPQGEKNYKLIPENQKQK